MLRIAVVLIIGATLLLLAGWLASEVFEGETLAFDLAVRDQIHASASPWLTTVMIVVSFLGSPTFLIVLGILAVVGFFVLHHPRSAALFAITMAGETILSWALKGYYTRVRPEPFFNYPLPASYSFPSGHAFGSFCFYGVLVCLATERMKSAPAVWSIRTAGAILVFWIGLSRVYLGVHYPTDVLAGYLIGLMWTATVLIIYEYWRSRLAKSA